MTAKKENTMNDLSYELIDISPAIAEEFLTANTHNRALRERVVALYAGDMRDKRWVENGESIKIAVDGTVIDGQHRLEAIVGSGTTQKMLVVRNLPMSVQESIDTGSKRTFADVLRLRGEVDTNNLAALCRRVAAWENGQGMAGNRSSASTAQMIAVLDAHPELRASIAVSSALRMHLKMQGAVVAFTHWLFSEIDATDTDAFFTGLRDGADLGRTHPIYVLRRTVIDHSMRTARLPESMLTAFTIKAWNAYREGREISFLRFRPGGVQAEDFPEPI